MALTKNCFCMCLLPPALTAASGKAIAGRRAALLEEAFWGPNPDITVAFLEGDPGLRKRVQEAAQLWSTETGARLTFAFLTAPGTDPSKADIRIAFQPGRGSWSRLGTQCRHVAKDKPTMNFGWLEPASSDEDVRSVVLHEFGHALGLIHEHQNPERPINWDRDAVRKDLGGPPNNWDDEKIERNIFNKYDPAKVVATSTDPLSIMMYSIPEHWTRDKFHTGFNKTLSDGDKRLISENYP